MLHIQPGKLAMPVRALVIDDSPTSREAIRFQLMAWGCEQVTEAGNAAEALHQLRASL
jgi:CheY-like chemotaxis protein